MYVYWNYYYYYEVLNLSNSWNTFLFYIYNANLPVVKDLHASLYESSMGGGYKPVEFPQYKDWVPIHMHLHYHISTEPSKRKD